MIDTIKLTLDKTMYLIQDTNRFEKGTMNATRGFFKMVQNPTVGELKRGIYKPRLTKTHRFNASGRSEETLAVELSLPKLVYGNNFEEMTDADFANTVELLRNKLKDMGVLVFSQLLRSAPVSSVHFSKNIPLTDGSIPYTYLSELKKINLNQSLDLNQTDFRNTGHSVKYHTNSFEVAFYDKLKDLRQAEKSEKRAEEWDSNIQLKLFEKVKIRQPFEVIRMEARLNKRQKLKQVLKAVGIEEDPTFMSVFNQATSQKVLLYFMSKIENDYPNLFAYKYKSLQEFHSDFIIHNPKKGLRKALQLLSLKIMTDKLGIREFREIIKNYGNNNWYRLYKEARSIKMPVPKSPFSILKDAIINFTPLKLVDFEALIVKNEAN